MTPDTLTRLASMIVAACLGFAAAGYLLTTAHDGEPVSTPVRVVVEPGVGCRTEGHTVTCYLTGGDR